DDDEADPERVPRPRREVRPKIGLLPLSRACPGAPSRHAALDPHDQRDDLRLVLGRRPDLPAKRGSDTLLQHCGIGDLILGARRPWVLRWRRSPCTRVNHRGRIRLRIIFSSSAAAWPEPWTGTTGTWNASAPARYSPSITRWIAGSFPGIIELLRTTVSPGSS